MSKYSWTKYNYKNEILAKKIIKYNRANKINFVEKGIYNHVRDILCLGMLIGKKKNKTNFLDYGSNLLALSNLVSKINLKTFNIYIYNPFSKKKITKSLFKVSIIQNKKKLKNKIFDVINFGSCIQYMEDFRIIENFLNLSKLSTVIITHTPLTLNNKYISKQSNHKNLNQTIHNYTSILSFFKKKKFKLIFKSRNEDKYIACTNKKPKTYSLNLIFTKKQ